MFITENEANDRLRSSTNLLKRVNRDNDLSPVDRDIPLPPPPPSLSTEDEEELSETELAKLLDADKRDPRNPRRIPKRRKTEEEQVAIGLTASLVSSGAAGRMFDLSQAQSNNLEHAYTNTSDRYDPSASPKESLRRKMDEKREEVLDRAFAKLLNALELLTPQQLSGIKKSTDISRIATDMSRIINVVAPKELPDNATVHFHVWRPEMKPVESYEVIEVGGAK